MPLWTFNKVTAATGVAYAAALFYFYRRLKAVWAREAVRSRIVFFVFTCLFLSLIGAITWTYYCIKKQRFAMRRAADIIQKQKEKPLKVVRTNNFGRLVKITAALLLAFICIHRIMRKT